MKTVTIGELKKIDDVLKKSGMQILQTVRVKLGNTFTPAALTNGKKPAGKPGPKTKATPPKKDAGGKVDVQPSDK